MALRDTINGVLDKVRGMLSREPKAMDAFGGDDLFDGDGEGETTSNVGTKIALGVSGAMLLGLIGIVGAIFISGDDSASNTGGSLAGLQMEEDPAATEGSAERRPWLTPTQGGGARRLGVSDEAKTPETKAAEAKAASENAVGKSSALPTREVAKVEAIKPPPAGQDKQAEKKPEPTKTAEATPPAPAAPTPEKATAEKVTAEKVTAPTAVTATKPETAPQTPPTAPEVKAAPTTVAVTQTMPPPAKGPAVPDAKAPEATPPAAGKKPEDQKPAMVAETDDEPQPPENNQQTAAMPSLMSPALTAPGAPRRFESDNNGAASAGGKPRLNDPALPPVDRTSIGAPPPRFAAIAAIKADPAPAASSAKIAIIIEGLGLNKAATEAALTKLPPSVTLAFSPYARDLKRLIERAKQKGHEVLIEVPMESKTFPADDPGPLGLLTSLETKDNQERLETILKEATGAVGVFDGMGSKFRESQSHIGEVLGKLKQQNLFYVQGRPGIRVGESEVPSATTDVVIDERPFRAAVDARFDYAERLAKYQGSSVAVMTARPVSFERLALWVDQLPKKGIVLAPVSQVLAQ